MTPKHVAILTALRTYYFMPAALIRDVSSPNDKDVSVTREALRRLLALGFVRRHQPRLLEFGKTTAPPVYLLTTSGACALAAETGNVDHLLQVEPTFKDWISIHHYVSLAALHVTIDHALSVQTHVKRHALYFEHEVVCPDAMQPSKRFRLNSIVSEGPHIACCPDSAFEVEVRGHRRAIYVEREMGSDNPARVVAKKHKGYAGLAGGQFKAHFPLAHDMRVLAICPHAAWRDSLRAAFREDKTGLKIGAKLWLFVAAQDVTKEKFLHEPIVYTIEQKDGTVIGRGPIPFIPGPLPAVGGGSGGSGGGTL